MAKHTTFQPKTPGYSLTMVECIKPSFNGLCYTVAHCYVIFPYDLGILPQAGVSKTSLLYEVLCSWYLSIVLSISSESCQARHASFEEAAELCRPGTRSGVFLQANSLPRIAV